MYLLLLPIILITKYSITCLFAYDLQVIDCKKSLRLYLDPLHGQQQHSITCTNIPALKQLIDNIRYVKICGVIQILKMITLYLYTVRPAKPLYFGPCSASYHAKQRRLNHIFSQFYSTVVNIKTGWKSRDWQLPIGRGWKRLAEVGRAEPRHFSQRGKWPGCYGELERRFW